ncbi:MAG: cobalamin-independent methionine synthase II family protein [Bryobacteraceae bacterium]
MKRSTDRILSTHVGSIIRPSTLVEAIQARQSGKEADEHAYNECLRDSVGDIVQRQALAGIDVVNDGEFGKSTSWSLYALKRIEGFELREVPAGQSAFARGADREKFKDFYDEIEGSKQTKQWSNVTVKDAVCVGPLKYVGQAELQRDIDNLKAGLKAVQVEEAFLPVAAPSSAIPDRKNEYYKNDEELVVALAEALRTEYRMIADSGILLQVDDARAAVTYDRMVPPATFEDYYKWLERHVEVLNHALEGIPSDRIRYHVCWGSWPGPHVTDVPLKKIVDLILKVNAGAYLLEAANPRHEHEWQVWKDVKLPEGKILVPGVVSHGTNLVEHPELVAERLVRFAGCVGRENVIAGTDCGFAQEELNRRVHPSIMWAKLESMAEGAKIATKQLWGRKA